MACIKKCNYVDGETVITAENLNEIQDGLIQVEAQASAAQAAANNAQTAADSAWTAAGEAKAIADEALATAEALSGAATEAKASADNAQGTADSASLAAGRAQAAADNASQTAAAAQQTAGNAQTAAEAAAAAAAAAQATAAEAKQLASQPAAPTEHTHADLIDPVNGYRATMQNDGNLVVYDPDGAALWASKAGSSGGASTAAEVSFVPPVGMAATHVQAALEEHQDAINEQNSKISDVVSNNVTASGEVTPSYIRVLRLGRLRFLELVVQAKSEISVGGGITIGTLDQEDIPAYGTETNTTILSGSTLSLCTVTLNVDGKINCHPKSSKLSASSWICYTQAYIAKQ